MGKKGFTLIELIIVVVIIGILAAIAAPMMSGNVDRAKRSEAVAALGVIRTAMRLYYVENGGSAWPAGCYGTAINNYVNTSDLDGKYYQNTGYTISGNYISAVPIVAADALNINMNYKDGTLSK